MFVNKNHVGLSSTKWAQPLAGAIALLPHGATSCFTYAVRPWKSAPQSEIPVKCGGVHLLAIAQCVIEQSVYVSKYESEISLPISSFAMHSIFISIRSVPRVRIKASKHLNQVQGPYNKVFKVSRKQYTKSKHVTPMLAIHLCPAVQTPHSQTKTCSVKVHLILIHAGRLQL